MYAGLDPLVSCSTMLSNFVFLYLMIQRQYIYLETTSRVLFRPCLGISVELVRFCLYLQMGACCNAGSYDIFYLPFFFKSIRNHGIIWQRYNRFYPSGSYTIESIKYVLNFRVHVSASCNVAIFPSSRSDSLYLLCMLLYLNS